jgi:hypothetical protein
VQPDLLTSVLDLTGVFANGLLGGAVARSQGLDLFGFGASRSGCATRTVTGRLTRAGPPGTGEARPGRTVPVSPR